MPIDISWYIPSRVIRAHVYGKIEPEHFVVFPTTVKRYVLNSDAPIHILLDDGEAIGPPRTIPQLHKLLRFRMHHASQIGWIVGVGDVSMMANVILPVLFKTMGLQFKRVRTLDDAMTFLVSQDPTLEESMMCPDTEV